MNDIRYMTPNGLRKLTITNLVFSAILWLNGLLELLFNLLGLWAPWALAGYAYFFLMWLPLGVAVFACVICVKQYDAELRKTYLLRNGTMRLISIVMSLLAIFVFSTWFW